MKINSYHQKELIEDHVDVYYRKKTEEIIDILSYLNKEQTTILASWEGRQKILSLSDIYYFESVDKKVFIYDEGNVYNTDFTLQFIEEMGRKFGFIRVNKSTIINIYKIAHMKTDTQMRIIATLKNEERIQINRSYRKPFNDFLQSYSKGVKA